LRDPPEFFQCQAIVSLAVADNRTSLSPEARLLLLTTAVSPSDAALRQALSAGVNWERLYPLARYEKAASVLLRHLGLSGAARSSPGYEALRQLATISVMEMLQLEQLLHQTLDILAREDIEALLLKGAGLAYTAYSSFADRPMGDIDLLVRPQHAARAWSLLQKHGWRPAVDSGSERYVGHHHLPPLFQDSGRFRLEIHEELLPAEHPFRFSADALWQHARRITVKGRVITVLDPVHQLWHECVHFAWSHAMQWGSWRTLRDSAAIIQADDFDWTEFVRFARETRAATCCFWTLRVTRTVTGAAVPDHVLSSLRPPYPEFIIDRLERHFVSSLFPSEDRCPSVWLTRWLWTVGVSPRWSRHGAARPWQVSERWTANSKSLKSQESDPRAVGWVRRMTAGITYLLRLSHFSLPINTVNVRTSE
jgi:hypothetical protein